MSAETYRGRRISVRPRKGRYGERTFDVRVNGKAAAFAMQYGPDAGAEILAQLKRDLDDIDERAARGDWGWEPHYYAPGTYETCEHGHPHGIGQPCGNGYCVRVRAEVRP